jgi:nucleoside-triphosphatase
MKLLITGEPRAGKTTLLEGFAEAVSEKQGFVTHELRENGERVGFELISSLGDRALLASVESEGPVRVSRYGIDVESLDNFLAALPVPGAGKLIYVDEIGQMQLFSDLFKQKIRDYLDAPNFYAGTITNVYEDDFTREILERNDVVLLRATVENRERMEDVLSCLAKNISLVDMLDANARAYLLELAQEYAVNGSFIQMKKLFGNAIKYVAENKVSKKEQGYLVIGNNNEHLVSTAGAGELLCDCDLFNGRGVYENQAGECSHIQAVKLYGK